MEKKEFVKKIKEILLIEEEVDDNFFVKIDSLSSLILIQFYDENFDFRLGSEKLKELKRIEDFVELVKDKLT